MEHSNSLPNLQRSSFRIKWITNTNYKDQLSNTDFCSKQPKKIGTLNTIAVWDDERSFEQVL